MRRFSILIVVLATFLASPGPAQDDSATRIERFLQDSLSGEGRTVRIRGFRGALTGRAELASLTFSDGDGEWLTLTDAVLDWDRAALLSGQLDVREISAARIDFPRLPNVESDGFPSPEASGTDLSLPELPVSIKIGQLSAQTVTIGEPILGQAVQVSLEGRINLADGEGSAELSMQRTDGKRGRIDLDADFSNVSRVLGVRALFDEGPDGIAVGALGLPDAPALSLEIEGIGPIDNFEADLSLATDGTERLGARFSTTSDSSDRLFDIDAEGDLSPLVNEDIRPFFGEMAELTVQLRRTAKGVNLDNLSLSTAALSLAGNARFASDGLPTAFDLSGLVANPNGGSLRLPLSGRATSIVEATLDLEFDAAQDDQWQGTVEVQGLERQGLSAERLSLSGSGLVAAAPNRMTLEADFVADALDFSVQSAQDAFGERVEGRIDLSWEEDRPVEISTLRLAGESYSAQLSGNVSNPTTSLDLAGSGSVWITDLRAFAGLAARPLSGDVNLTVNGSAGVFTGLADLRAAGLGTNIVVGNDRLDPYLSGSSAIELALRRTVTGTFVDTLRMTSPVADIEADGELRSSTGRVHASAFLETVAPLYPGLNGAGQVNLSAEMTDGVWTYGLESTAMAAELAAEGTASGLSDNPVIAASGTIEASDFSLFSELAGQTLGGRGETTFALRAIPRERSLSIDAESELADASVGIREIDASLAGTSKLTASAEVDGSTLSVSRLELVSDIANVKLSGLVEEGVPRNARATVSFTDLDPLLTGFAGPADAVFNLEGPDENLDQPFEGTVSSAAGNLSASGTLRELDRVPRGSGELSADIADLSLFSRLLGQPLGGRLRLVASGSAAADLSTFSVEADAETLSLRTGIETVDRILAGEGQFSLRTSKENGRITIARATGKTPLATVSGEGAIGQRTSFAFDGQLADISPFVPGLTGSVTAEARAETLGNGRAAVNARVNAPANTALAISGDISEDGSDASLAASGQAGLSLLNQVLAPRALSGTAGLNFTLRGRPSLDAISGQIALDGARLIAPVAGLGLDDIRGTIAINRSRAEVNLTGGFQDGGQLVVAGPVALSGQQTADFDLRLTDVRLTDPALYQTRLNGALAIEGPLQGGALISGRINVGETELRIPTGRATSGAGLPEIRHVDEPERVRETRRRAGLLDSNGSQATAGNPFPLDVTVDAPNQIFVRGRGLDAELGGRIRLRGTTRDVAPDGRLDLIRGRLDILGRRLEMTSGGIQLTGALDPEIQLVAETEADDVDVEIVVNGPASDPDVSFNSRPELPEDEVLARLLFGQGIDNLSPLQIARLAAAVVTLGSSGGGLIGGARAGAGLADLDVTSTEDGGAAVRAGTYINENVYTDLSVDTEGNTEVQLNLDLSKSLKVRGRTSTSGNSGVGVFFERDY